MILIPNPKHGEEIDQIDSMYPTKMVSVQDDYRIKDTIGNMYGFCTKGTFTIHADDSWTIKNLYNHQYMTIFHFFQICQSY